MYKNLNETAGRHNHSQKNFTATNLNTVMNLQIKSTNLILTEQNYSMNRELSYQMSEDQICSYSCIATPAVEIFSNINLPNYNQPNLWLGWHYLRNTVEGASNHLTFLNFFEESANVFLPNGWTTSFNVRRPCDNR